MCRNQKTNNGKYPKICVIEIIATLILRSHSVIAIMDNYLQYTLSLCKMHLFILHSVFFQTTGLTLSGLVQIKIYLYTFLLFLADGFSR